MSSSDISAAVSSYVTVAAGTSVLARKAGSDELFSNT